MSGAIPPLPKYAFMARCSVKRTHRDNFYLYLYIEQIGYWIYVAKDRNQWRVLVNTITNHRVA